MGIRQRKVMHPFRDLLIYPLQLEFQVLITYGFYMYYFTGHVCNVCAFFSMFTATICKFCLCCNVDLVRFCASPDIYNYIFYFFG